MSSWSVFKKKTAGKYTSAELAVIKEKYFTPGGAMKDIVLGYRNVAPVEKEKP